MSGKRVLVVMVLGAVAAAAAAATVVVLAVSVLSVVVVRSGSIQSNQAKQQDVTQRTLGPGARNHSLQMPAANCQCQCFFLWAVLSVARQRE